MFQKIEKQFEIESIGFYYDRVFSKDHDFKGERHDFIELVYVCEGSAQIVENENIYTLNNGDFVLHAPMEFHRIKSAADTAPHVYNLSIMVSGAFPTQLFDGVYHLSREQQTKYMECLHLAEQFLIPQDTDAYLGQQVAGGLTSFLLNLCQKTHKSDSFFIDSGALLYRKLAKSMQVAVDENLTLESLARKNYISVSYVKKLFRTYANVTPKEFYDELRVKEAMDQLQNGRSVTEIARKMNFSSPNFFCAFFKRHTGVTPSAYKKRHGFDV
ncbi:MAG: AraC family transcriptional regulator [Oscillospiraceae bacterium]|nr:AraC family transcriptional regulator [Oscillospiraceae bacterium]